jgi:phage shock protein A
MSEKQLERLKKDSHELDHYIQRMRKKGRDDLAYKLIQKQAFLNQTIVEQMTQ